MTEALSTVTFALALLLYGGASALFYVEVARQRDTKGPSPAGTTRGGALAPRLLTFAALGHAAYVGLASFVAHVCPIHSVHFFLSVASLFSIAAYLTLRTRFRIGPLGLLVSPLGLAFLLGTYFLGKASPEPRLSPWFIAVHVLAILLGIALFLLAGGAAGLYLVQERRLKQKRLVAPRLAALPPLDALDHAEHRFLVAAFPLLTIGIVSGTYWAQKLESGSADELMRSVFGYAMWLLIAGVLLLRAAAGWRGKRSAYGTIAGLVCAAAVVAIYAFRPAAPAPPPTVQTGAQG